MPAPIPQRLVEFLREQVVPYRVLHHPLAYTAQELSAIEGVSGRQHAKVVILTTGQRLVMAVLPADRRLDLARLEKIVGQPVVLASEVEMKERFPDCAVGTMPPFGQLYGVATYLDRSLAGVERIVFEAGTHSDAVKIRYADYERLAKPTVAEFAVKLG